MWQLLWFSNPRSFGRAEGIQTLDAPSSSLKRPNGKRSETQESTAQPKSE